MRSTPETVLAKLSRAAVRSFWTPSRRATLTAIAEMVSNAVTRLFHRLLQARFRVAVAMASTDLRGSAVDIAHGEGAVELAAERSVMADKQQGDFVRAA